MTDVMGEFTMSGSPFGHDGSRLQLKAYHFLLIPFFPSSGAVFPVSVTTLFVEQHKVYTLIRPMQEACRMYIMPRQQNNNSSLPKNRSAI